jgi:hypothetical protein
MNQTNMKTFSSKKLFLSTAVLAVGILGDTLAQAQPADGGWTNRYGPGQAIAVAVDGSGDVVVTGSSMDTDSGSFLDYVTIKYSGEGVPLWTNRYGPGQATAMAVDGSGNVFVTGNSDNDYATVAYSGAGVPLWTNRYNGPGNDADFANGLAVDGSGNVVVTGYSYRSGHVNPDYATIKYSGAGVPLWTNRYNGPGNSTAVAYAVTVDGSDNVLVTGYSTAGSFTSSDYTTIKYSGAGVPLWTNRYSGPGNANDIAKAVAVDGSGNVFVTGYSPGSGSSWDYATVGYSSAGALLWTNRYNGPGNSLDSATAVAVDGSGNVFVTGQSYGSGFVNPQYATIKYSGAGVPLWTNRYSGLAYNVDDGTSANALAVDSSGNVFVTGNSYNSGSFLDYATIKYSGAGVPLWTNRYNGPDNGNDRAAAIAVDGSGNVIVTGNSFGSFGTVAYYSSARVPLLAIARTMANTLSVSWPSPSTGFTLQQNTNGLAAGNWNDVLDTPADDGTNKTVILNPPAAGNRFYRLLKP